MSANAALQIALLLGLVVLLAKPLGLYMARVYEGKPSGLDPLLGPVERGIYRACRIAPEEEMDWKGYAKAMLFFHAAGFVALYGLQRLQGLLPFNPAGAGAVEPLLALNTSVSFVTNTNWQNYAGEATLSHFTQMAGMTVQNFLSAASGMAVLVALVRGIARRNEPTVGNFWKDMVRGVLYILLPLSLLLALFLVSQGVVQTLAGSATATSLEGGTQYLSLGPIASQEAIKELGTNGGGFLNANSAHPFENPTPLSNFAEMAALILLGAGLCVAFGQMAKDRRQGWALLATMALLLLPPLLLCLRQEQAGNPLLARLGVDAKTSVLQAGGNLEGKEVRFGVTNSATFAALTTATSCGAVNSMHDSYTPLGGLALLVLMQLGEVALGGVGSGLFGLLLFVLVAVFAAGLMVGRTPEYLGKKIEPFEMKMAALAILAMPVAVLLGTALACVTAAGAAGAFNPGPHGFSEILYAFTSAGNNNGSAFAGLNGNTPFYNLGLVAAMFAGRFLVMLPVLAIAGSLANKKTIPAGPGTLPTHTPLFVLWTAAVVLLVGGLTFFPALALGPLAEFVSRVP